MFEHAILLDPGFALAHAGIANACGLVYEWHEKEERWLERGRAACEQRARARPEPARGARRPRAALLHAAPLRRLDARRAGARSSSRRTATGAYNILARSLFESDRWAEALETSARRSR